MKVKSEDSFRKYTLILSLSLQIDIINSEDAYAILQLNDDMISFRSVLDNERTSAMGFKAVYRQICPAV